MSEETHQIHMSNIICYWFHNKLYRPFFVWRVHWNHNSLSDSCR